MVPILFAAFVRPLALECGVLNGIDEIYTDKRRKPVMIGRRH